jgi:hypothetical protein
LKVWFASFNQLLRKPSIFKMNKLQEIEDYVDNISDVKILRSLVKRYAKLVIELRKARTP